MEGVNSVLVKELLGKFTGFYNVMAALRGPDVAQTEMLKWAFTGFIRGCVLESSLGEVVLFRKERLFQQDVSCLIPDLKALLQEAAERPSIWVKGVGHYLVHAEHALRVLEKCRSLSHMERWEAESLRSLIAIVKLRFQLVCDGKEPLCYALPALEDTVLSWYVIYSKRWEITPG